MYSSNSEGVVDLLMAYSKRLDLLSDLVSAGTTARELAEQFTSARAALSDFSRSGVHGARLLAPSASLFVSGELTRRGTVLSSSHYSYGEHMSKLDLARCYRFTVHRCVGVGFGGGLALW
jgi:hypothetical protein